MTQTGFGFETQPGFDFGGQGAFHFDPEQEWERAQREARRARQAREERERQQRDRQRQREARQSYMGDNPYDVLGIARDASDKEIRAAWVRLCKELHPDAGGDVRKMQAVNAAYERLKRRRS